MLVAPHTMMASGNDSANSWSSHYVGKQNSVCQTVCVADNSCVCVCVSVA